MVKKLSAIILAIFGSVLFLCGCGDPYKDLKLTASTNSIVLYLNEAVGSEGNEATDGETSGGESSEGEPGSLSPGQSATDAEISAAYPSVTSFVLKLDGVEKGVSTNVTISQYAYNGVEDIVKIEQITSNITGKDGGDDGARYQVTALRSGSGLIVITTAEGNKRVEIEVSVKVPVKGISFSNTAKAVKYLSSIDLYKFVTYNPSTTDQKDITFYLNAPSGEGVASDEVGVIETDYAKIENGVLVTKESPGYPVDSMGNRYVQIYGVSKFNPNIKTQVINLPVIEVINPDDIVLTTTAETESGYVQLQKTSNNYEIVLGHNIPDNPYIYSRDLTLKLSEEYVVDQQYVITTNYSHLITAESVFELTESVLEENRYSYSGVKENYPYKKYNFSQIATGSKTLEIYVDRRGYEGLFTITLKVKVTVKDFGTQLFATKEDGQSAIVNGVTIYNAYGSQQSLGTSVVLNLTPNPNNAYKIHLNLTGAPQVSGLPGIKMSLVNTNEVYSGSSVASGTRIYFKHVYSYEEITQILGGTQPPTLVISYIYSLAPVEGTTGYATYSIEERIPLIVEAGVDDISVPAGNQEIKINAVTGQAVGEAGAVEASNNLSFSTSILEEPGAEPDGETPDGETPEGETPEGGEEEVEANEIVLVTIGDQPADLAKLIKSVTIINIDGVQTNINALTPNSNTFFDVVFKEGPLLGKYNRLIIEPKLQAKQGRLVLEIKTNNYITKTVVVEVFVPIAYDAANTSAVNVEIHSENTVGSYIYEATKSKHHVVYDGALTIVPDDVLPEELVGTTTVYSTLEALTLAVNSRVGLNVFNYVVLNNSKGEPVVTRVNYNSNISVSQSREYFTIEYESINGVSVPFIVTKKLKTATPITMAISVTGYDANGAQVSLIKNINITIIEPITSISLTPVSSTLYTENSLGALRSEQSRLKYSLNVYPVNATINAGTIVEYRYRNDVLYTLKADSGNSYNIRVEHILSYDSTTGEFVASVQEERISNILSAFTADSGISIDSSQVIKSIFENNVIVTVYAALQQYDKPEITTSATITIRNAEKVEKIIPSSDINGIYFDLRKITESYEGHTITFNVLPSTANNKTLIVNIADESVVKIVSGVDQNNRIIGNKIVIKPNNTAGRTSIRITPEDSYYKDGNTGAIMPGPSIYIPIRVADGTKAYPFEIKNPDEFMEIGEDIADGNNEYYYVLVQTFSMAAFDFTPFDAFFGGLSGNFTYEVDGINYTQQNSLYGLNFNIEVNPTNPDLEYHYGLFKTLAQTAEIEGVNLVDVNYQLSAQNSDFENEINIGGIAGVSYGTINDCSVSGKISVNSNVKNLNIGGVAGKVLAFVEIYPAEEMFAIAGTISGKQSATNFSAGSETANVQITFIGSSEVTDANVNIGGVSGSVESFTYTDSIGEVTLVGSDFSGFGDLLPIPVHKGVGVYQTISQPVIQNLVVASSIVSVNESAQPYKANIGGAFGYSNSTLMENITVATVLRGHSNVGGIIGKAEHSIIMNSAVEFANQGQTGANTIAISGYNNVGGLVGYAENVNILYSYVRAYFNNKAIDNSTYFGNIALLESTEATKNIGGLIGYAEATTISDELKNLGHTGFTLDTLIDAEYDISDYVNNQSSNGIFHSYFNADINASYQPLSGIVNVGGLIGATTEAGKALTGNIDSVLIEDSYVYGNIKLPETKTFSFTNYKTFPADNSFVIGTYTSYAAGNIESVNPSYYDYSIGDISTGSSNLIEIITQGIGETHVVGEEPDTTSYQVQNITLKVHYVAKLIGNQTLSVVEGSVTETKNETIESIQTIEQTKQITINSLLPQDVKAHRVYYLINGNGAIISYIVNSSYAMFDIVSSETIVHDPTRLRYDINNTTTYSYMSLSETQKFIDAGFSIVVADITNVENYKSSVWLKCAEINGGNPILFAKTHNNGQILFKVLPTQITINIVDNAALDFSNISYIKDGENLVLLYNEQISGRAYKYVNYYKLVSSDEPAGAAEPITALNVNLDIVDLYTKYGINANYDKNMIVTSSNPNIVSVENGNLIKTMATGTVTLKIASKLDVSIYDEINILVVKGLSDFALYKTKNLTTEANKLVSINKGEIVSDDSDAKLVGAITQVIDKTSNYYVDTINEDSALLMDYNGTYVKNTSVGVMMEVSGTGNGRAVVNGISLEKGVTYLFTSLNEFSFTGTQKGLIYVTLTPFLITNNSQFGSTIYQTTSNALSMDNCILINQLTKTYKFNVVPKAESIKVDKSAANLDPIKYVDLTVTTVTSDFALIGENYEVNEIINVTMVDLKTNRTAAAFVLDMNGVGTNNSFISFEILNRSTNETDDELKIELVYSLRLRFDTEKYKNRTGDVTFNLKDIGYKINFFPTSNTGILASFNIQIVPRVVQEVQMAYYPNAETSASGKFYPQEAESEYIVPSRVGLLKIELLPDYNNAEYVELTVEESMSSYVTFVQNLAIMAEGENSYVTGYRKTLSDPDVLPNFRGVRLLNQSVIVNGTTIYYNGNYYVQVFLSENAPVNQQITFTATAYRTANGEVISIISMPITLTIQPLPSINLTYNGEHSGLIAKGTTAELEVVASNFEGDVHLISTSVLGDATNVSVPRYDSETGKWYVDIGVNAQAGDVAIIKATASRFLNGVLEERTDEVRLTIVEYIINGVRLSGASVVGGNYHYEVLNGQTHPLSVVFEITKSEENENVDDLLTSLEQQASGRAMPLNSGSYVNNWWRVVNGKFDAPLYSNTTYGNYQFVEAKTSDMDKTNYFAIRTISVSTTNVIGYRMKYYYNEIGVPTIYVGSGNSVYDIYEVEFTFTLIIKDNSTYDHPNPIATVSEFMALGGLTANGEALEAGAVTEGHYILVNDLVLDNYYPFAANFSTLDGNGHIITINSINTEKYQGSSGANVGLFETISANTIIKNITIDISPMLVTTKMANEALKAEVGYTAHIDLSNVTSFNFGVLAGQNNGSITNAKIINTKQTTMNDATYKNLLINSTVGYLNGSLVEAKVGGLVAINNGSISNSYVGLNAKNYLNEDSSTELRSKVGESGSTTIQIYPFNIVGGKSIAGFVNSNNGILANNYILGVGIINSATIMEGTQTAGYVVENNQSGTIFNSMVEGLRTNNYRADDQVYIEAKGYIGGFVYINNGQISNAYSNIKITTNSGGSGGFVYKNEQKGVITNAYSTVSNANNSLAHGQFTGIDDKDNYNNVGTLTSCYYLILEGETENANEPATGIIGKYIEGDGAVSEEEDEEETSNDNPFRDTGSFNGFNFASGNDKNNIWQISQTTMHLGPRLISASQMTTFSHRVLMHSATGSGGETIYNYTYDVECSYGSELNPLLVNTATELVTFIINNKQTFTFGSEAKHVFGIATTDALSSKAHYIRLINDLDFSAITLESLKVNDLEISQIVFAGVLDGNGMNINGLTLIDKKTEEVHENFGLFAQVGLKESEIAQLGTGNIVNSAIMNLSVTIKSVEASYASKVGVLAGSMYNTSLINVTINGDKESSINGYNVVGGFAGLIKNSQDKLITNITANNISAKAAYVSASVPDSTLVDRYGKAYNVENSTDTYLEFSSYKTQPNVKELSYAGAIAGIIDNNNRLTDNIGENIKTSLENAEKIVVSGSNVTYPTAAGSTETNPADTSNVNAAVDNINAHRTKPANNLVSKIIVQGGGYITAEHAGGMFGYIGENTHVKNSRYLLGQIKTGAEEGENAVAFQQKIIGSHYAGAIVAENYGMLEQVYVDYVDDYKASVAEAFNSGTRVTGEIEDLFGSSAVVAIGGIAGYSASSIILDSYTIVDVANAAANIAGGLVGITAGTNYFSHVIASGDVLAKNRIGGLIGLYDSLYCDYCEATDATVTKAPKLMLDYAFAINEWSSKAEDLLRETLKSQYKKSDGNYEFIVRMPEVGNQPFNVVTTSTQSGVKFDYETTSTFVGSLIGFVNAGTINASGGKITTVSPADEITENQLKAVVEKGRITQIVNNGSGDRYLFSTVVSTTFGSAKLSKNTGLASTDEEYVVEENADYYQELSKSTGASGIGDKLEFTNLIGNQFKVNTILGRLNENAVISNATMFNMFIWDSIATGASGFDKAGSKVWRLGSVLPEYIIGIFSNFNKIESITDIYNKLVATRETRNQFYLLENDTYTLNDDGAEHGSYADYFRNDFEGTIIGVTKEVGGKQVNPKIVLNVTPNEKFTTIFKKLSTASIMNVDFEVNYVPTDGLAASSTLRMEASNSVYDGFFAKEIHSSVLSNVNFNINFKTNYNITYWDTYEAIGLMVGYLRDSSLQNVSVTINNTAEAVDKVPELKKLNLASRATKSMSFGGVVGYASKSRLGNVDVYAYNDSIINLSANNPTTHIGSVVGYSDNMEIYRVNLENINMVGDATTFATTSNNLFNAKSISDSTELNYGGIVGYMVNSTLTTTYFKGDILYGQDGTVNTNLNLGGIAGICRNSTIEHANVNDIIQISGASLDRVIMQKTDPLDSDNDINYEIKVKNGTSSILVATKVGGIVGYGNNAKILGNTTNGLNTSNSSNIFVETYAKETKVGGIAGHIENTENVTISKVANAGNISVDVSGTSTSANTSIGGIIGFAFGGRYAMFYNIGDIVFDASSSYSVGSIFGVSKTGTNYETLNLSRFVNTADIYFTGTSDYIPNNEGGAVTGRYIGGVAGRLEGNASTFEGGYTLARIYWEKDTDVYVQFAINNQDVGGVNGIAYTGEISATTFKYVYFVFDFLPYSNYSNASAQDYGAKTYVSASETEANFGGVEYANLPSVLNSQLSNYFTTSNVTDFVVTTEGGVVTALNLPNEFKAESSENESMYSLLNYLTNQPVDITLSAEKLNPVKLTQVQDHEILSNKYYIMDSTNCNGKKIDVKDSTTFTGLLTSNSRANAPKIYLLGNGKPLETNYGCLSNFIIHYEKNIGSTVAGLAAKVSEEGMLLKVNEGNIINCVTYGHTFDSETLIFTGEIVTFVKTNNANIVQSGSIVMFAGDDTFANASNIVSGFVNTNNGFIKDCYSLTSLINTNAENTSFFGSVGTVAGFVIANTGVIETSYYAGSLTPANLSSGVFVNNNTGTIRNCYYDGEATPVGDDKDALTNESMKAKTDDFEGKAKYLTTRSFIETSENTRPFYSIALSTTYVPSAFITSLNSSYDSDVYNYGYVGIDNAIKIPTLYTISTSGDASDPHSVTAAFQTSGSFGIYHVGQLNQFASFQDSETSRDLFLQTSLDLSKINFGLSKAKIVSSEQLSDATDLTVNFYGFKQNLSNLTIDAESGRTALFNSISSGKRVEHFNIVTANVTTASGPAGVVVATNSGGAISYVNISDATINSSHEAGVGAIAGLYTGAGSISNCELTKITITGTTNIGGAVGIHQGALISDISITDVSISGVNNLGGLVGTSQKTTGSTGEVVEIKNSVVNSGTIDSSLSTDAISKIRGTTSNWISKHADYATTYFKSGANAGGLVGHLNEGAKLSNSQVLKITINAAIGAGGLVGLVDSGAEVNNNNKNFTGTTASDIQLIGSDAGSYVLGGIAGINKGTIKGNSNSSVYAVIGKDRHIEGEDRSKVGEKASNNRHDAALGGIAGVTDGGTIDGVIVESSTLYGNKLIGGLIGYAFNGGKVTNSKFQNSTIYSQSEYDIDEFNGQMQSDFKLGIGSNTSYHDTNFNERFGLGGDNAKLFNCDYTKQYYVMEYGGVESKVGENTVCTIKGKEEFKVLLGLLSGGHASTKPDFTGSSSNNSQIKGLYDEYRNYVVDVRDYKVAFSPNWTKIARKIQKGIRNFDTAIDSSYFYHGGDAYKKYTNKFNELGREDYTYTNSSGYSSTAYPLRTSTSSDTKYQASGYSNGTYIIHTLFTALKEASKSNQDGLTYAQNNYNEIWTNKYTYYRYCYYSYSEQSHEASVTYANNQMLAYEHLNIKAYSYPGLEWLDAGTVKDTTEVAIDEVQYSGHNKWGAPLPLNVFVNTKFTDTSGADDTFNKG